MEVRLHGDWILPELQDTAFVIKRRDAEVFDAKITEETKVTVKDQLQVPRYLALAEQYIEDNRKCICMKCGTMMFVPRPKPKVDPAAVAANMQQAQQNAANLFGGGALTPFGGLPPGVTPPTSGASPHIIQMWDNKFTEADLDSMLTDVGENPLNFSTKADKIQFLIDRLY